MIENLREVFYRAFKEMDAFNVPGIGTFRKKVLASRIDHSNQSILPPTMAFQLEPEGQPARSLEDYFFRSMEVTVAKASELVAYVADYFRTETAEGGEVAIPEIGTLVFQSGKFELRNQVAGDFQNPDFFGLTPVQFTFANRKAEPTGQTKEQVIVSALASRGVKTEEPRPITRPKRKMWPVVLILLLLGLGAAGFVFRNDIKGWIASSGTPGTGQDSTLALADRLKNNDSKTSEDGETKGNQDGQLSHTTDAGTKPNTDPKSTVTSNSTVSKDHKGKPEINKDIKVEPKATPKTEIKTTTPVKEKPQVQNTNSSQVNIGKNAQSGKFYLVVSSTMNPDEAKSLSTEQGVPSEIIKPAGGPGSGFYKISVFESADKAKVIQKMVEWKTRFSKSWIYWAGM